MSRTFENIEFGSQILDLRVDLDFLLETVRLQGALTDYQRGQLTAMIRWWKAVKPNCPESYQSVIEDRISACLSYVPKSLWPQEALEL